MRMIPQVSMVMSSFSGRETGAFVSTTLGSSVAYSDGKVYITID
jgi:hypothetical protein